MADSISFPWRFPLGEVETKGAAEAAEVNREQVPVPAEDYNVTIAVESYLPEDTPTYYSDAMMVTHSANEFVVSFLQTEFPLATSKEELEQVKSLKRKCVARIIMSPAHFEAVSKVLYDNLKKYQDSYRKLQPE
jgi:hypothetical protein